MVHDSEAQGKRLTPLTTVAAETIGLIAYSSMRISPQRRRGRREKQFRLSERQIPHPAEASGTLKARPHPQKTRLGSGWQVESSVVRPKWS